MDRHIHLEGQERGVYAGLLGRPVHGFRWVRDHEPDGLRPHPVSQMSPSRGPWLIPNPDPDADCPGEYHERRYAPFRDRRGVNLHRQFARIAACPPRKRHDAVLGFADRFGFLGKPNELVSLLPTPRPVRWSNRDCIPGEHEKVWWREGCELAALLALWDRVKAEQRGEVAKYVYATRGRVEAFLAWQDGRLTTNRSRFDVEWRIPVFYDVTGKSVQAELVAGEGSSLGEYRTVLFPELRGGRPDVLRAARLFLFDHANAKLWGNVSPQLRAEAEPGRQVRLYPHSLLATIWLNFVDDMSQSRAAGTACANPQCGQPIDPSFGRKYCNDNCKSQANFRRNGRRKAG